jgi:NDP-sugar pyrophosphorylase family protein
MKNQENRTAVILCGGKGTRLGLIGKKIPKTLVKVQGKEILKYILYHLIKSKFNKIILPVGYRGNMIKKLVSKNFIFKRFVRIISTGKNSGIGKRIASIVKYLESKNTLILNGDAIFDFNISKIYYLHKKKNCDLSFLSTEITYPYGTIGVVNGKIIDFRRNLKYHILKTNKKNYDAYNYTGMILIKTSILKKYRNTFKNFENFESKFYPIIIKKYKSQLLKFKSFWHSIDSTKDIIEVNNIKENKIKFLKLKKIKKKIVGYYENR